MIFTKWISLTVWHLQPKGEPRTLCGEEMPPNHRDVVRVERPATTLKVCVKCEKVKATGRQLKLKPAPASTPAGRFPPRSRWP